MAALPEEEKKESTGKLSAKFTSNLLKKLQLGKAELSDNLVCSPLSAQSALSILIAGADHDTLDELNSVLFGEYSEDDHREWGKQHTTELLQLCNDLDKKYSSKPVLNIVQRVWVNAKVTFKDDFASFVGECARLLDVSNPDEAANKVNGWVEDNTGGMIKQLVKSEMFSEDFIAAITNAIYFNGKFQTPFKAANTSEGVSFFSDPLKKRERCRIKMMSAKKTIQLYSKSAQFTYVGLPYAKSDLQLIIALPNSDHGKPPTSKKVLSLKLKPKKIDFYLPKFRFSSDLDLIPPLKKMGLNRVFSPSESDLSLIAEMDADERIYVSDVIHKAVIEVNEVGTKAAAATAVVMKKTRTYVPVREELPVVRCDHPFSFFIVDTSDNTLIFAGTVTKPVWEKKSK